MKDLAALVLATGVLLAAMELTACGGGGTQATGQSRCNHLGEIRAGSFFLQNNMWGRDGVTGYEQCVRSGAPPVYFPVGWSWSWPAGNGDQVRGYPFIGFGQDPWRPASTTSALPRRAGDLAALTVDYTIQSISSGKYNLAFDIWVTRAPGVTSPPESNITREIMIWIDDAENPLPDEWRVSDITIDGAAYAYYRGEGDATAGYIRDYLAFVAKTPKLAGSIAVDAFVRELMARGHLRSDEYIRNVFLGNEVWHGTGDTTLVSYAIRVE